MSDGKQVSGDAWELHWARFADSASNNPAQEYRRKLVLARLRAGPAARVLDVGSGQGDLAVDLVRALPEADVAGVELSQTGIDIAAQKVPTARFYQFDLLQLIDVPPELGAWADAAVCSEVLEHVDDPTALLRSAVRLMAPGSRLIVTVPAGPRSAYDRHIGHRQHFTRALLRETLECAGLVDVVVEAAGWPFFNVYKLVVIARGARLIDDAAKPTGDAGRLASAVSAAFRMLFKLNTEKTPWGWQLVATASVPR